MSPRLLLLAALLASASVLTAAQKPKAKATPAAPAAAAPGGAAADGGSSSVTVEDTLSDAKYSTFKRLLKETRVNQQIDSQLMDSYNGLTMFAPTDAAFAALPAGTMNKLSSQDQIQLMLYCVLPRFYSLPMLSSLDGKVNTQASGADGPYKYTIKKQSNSLNVSTGYNSMLLSTVVSKDFPLAVYSVDKVPLPVELFGPQAPTPSPAPAPAPAKSKTKKKTKKSPAIADAPVADDSTAADAKNAAAPGAGLARWVAVVGGAALLGGGLF